VGGAAAGIFLKGEGRRRCRRTWEEL